MRYDWKSPIQVPADALTKEDFRAIDARLFHASYFAQPRGSTPFAAMLPSRLAGRTVLEVGCGFGSHAQLFAQAGAVYTGLDLTAPAVTATRRRLMLGGLPGTIMQGDAEHLPFPDGHFDVVWSWGVIDHTADTRRALSEIARVVRRGGEVRLMVYNRRSLTYWVTTMFVRGVLFGELRTLTPQQLVEKYCDGHFARMYTSGEWREELSRHWPINRVDVVGNRYELLLPLPRGLRHALLDRLPRAALDVFLRSYGSMLFSVSSSPA
jgi:SAM-dependent methyltransferase